jgi:AcrR family transcriptional regulator
VDTIGRKGYTRATLEDIAVAAGVSKGGIYWHFKGKDDLMAAIVAEYSPFPRVVAIVEGAQGVPFEEVMRQIFDALLRFVDQHGAFFRAIISEIQTNPELGAVFQRNVAGPLIRVLGGYLTSQMARGGFRPVPPILVLQALIGPLAVHMLTRSLLQQMGIQLDLAEVRDALLGIYLDGIRSHSKEAHHASTGD